MAGVELQRTLELQNPARSSNVTSRSDRFVAAPDMSGTQNIDNVPSEMAKISHFSDGGGPLRKALGAHGRDRTGKGETPEGF